MKIRKNCIGLTFIIKGFGKVEIKDDVSKFKLYKALNLDVFIKERKKKNVSDEEE